MTKKELVKAISEESDVPQVKVKDIVQRTFDLIVDTLVDDRRMELRNFGVFEVKRRAARQARNPKTGESVKVPAKYVVSFRPGKEMEGRVRLMERRERERAEEARRRAARPAAPPPAYGVAPPPGFAPGSPAYGRTPAAPPRPDPPPAVASGRD